MSESQTKPALLWLQSVTCNGNTHSFLNNTELFSVLSHFDLIHHPVLETAYSLEEMYLEELPCDILILEGAFRSAGLKKAGRETSAVIEKYAKKAKHIITAGTCATFGGIFKEYDPDMISGFCFDAENRTVRYRSYASKLISLPGCPIHPKWMNFVLKMLVDKKTIVLDEMHRPQELYGITVHTGCTRNEYFEWKVDTKGFGLKEGCLYYENGCQGPYTRGSCNKILWNDISSKTIAGTPCLGCTEPTFPKTALFSTKTNMGIPAIMPLGVPMRAYLTATGIAKSFSISRLKERIIEYDN